jgi:hypothetical protein
LYPLAGYCWAACGRGGAVHKDADSIGQFLCDKINQLESAKTLVGKCRQQEEYRVQDSKTQDVLQSQYMAWYVIAAQQQQKKKIKTK